MAKKEDIEIKRGTTLPITVTITDANGAPVDLTGATVYFTAKTAESDTDATDNNAAIKVDVTEHSDPTAGETEIVLTADDTTVNPASYHYDITVKYPAIGGADPVVNTVVEGKLKIDGKPTNRSV
jgi:hypothetical protein